MLIILGTFGVHLQKLPSIPHSSITTNMCHDHCTMEISANSSVSNKSSVCKISSEGDSCVGTSYCGLNQTNRLYSWTHLSKGSFHYAGSFSIVKTCLGANKHSLCFLRNFFHFTGICLECVWGSARKLLSSGTMSSKLSYQGSAYPTSYSQNGSSCQPVLSNGRQSSISVSENTITNIPTLASVFNSTSSALEKAHKSLLSPPLNFLGGLVGRLETTLHGSAHDIGWLQCTYPFNPVQDGTNRFMELLAVTRNGVHILPDKFVYFLVPGLFSNHFPLYFTDTKNLLTKLGLKCHIAQIHSEASVKTNAQELTKQIENLYVNHGKKVLVLGHSKGGVDAAAAMAMHWTNLKDKVAGLALVQSPYGGSPIASDILGEGQIAESVKRIILELLMCNFIKGDMSALEDLTYSKRKQFLSQYALPVDLPVISFHTEASTDAQALATLYHIRHIEFPSFAGLSSSLMSNQTVKVPIMAPLATAMAACASYLDLRYGEKSDGVVTRKDAEVPGSLVVKPNGKLDHACMTIPSSAFDVSEPNAPQMCEALLALLVEIGQGKNRRQKIALAK